MLSHIGLCAVAPTTMPSSIAAVPDSQPPAAPRHPVPATAAKNKVEQRQQHQRPTVSTPLNVDNLVLELFNHPDRTFVHNLVSALWYGARIWYLSAHQTRVSRHLLSASQHQRLSQQTSTSKCSLVSSRAPSVPHHSPISSVFP